MILNLALSLFDFQMFELLHINNEWALSYELADLASKLRIFFPNPFMFTYLFHHTVKNQLILTVAKQKIQ